MSKVCERQDHKRMNKTLVYETCQEVDFTEALSYDPPKKHYKQNFFHKIWLNVQAGQFWGINRETSGICCTLGKFDYQPLEVPSPELFLT
ncbi:hypothetical protein CEXT_438821 [Caerostris extrusa]|uniref:Uncharacterized protein n=1 Tax=Caerostris extrusa TaxID=172846 RepID=A0AAV4M612_CAEEX|nr:hypothetical protein CEXT_438821 [Caerostris extrusa]